MSTFCFCSFTVYTPHTFRTKVTSLHLSPQTSPKGFLFYSEERSQFLQEHEALCDPCGSPPRGNMSGLIPPHAPRSPCHSGVLALPVTCQACSHLCTSAQNTQVSASYLPWRPGRRGVLRDVTAPRPPPPRFTGLCVAHAAPTTLCPATQSLACVSWTGNYQDRARALLTATAPAPGTVLTTDTVSTCQ